MTESSTMVSESVDVGNSNGENKPPASQETTVKPGPKRSLVPALVVGLLMVAVAALTFFISSREQLLEPPPPRITSSAMVESRSDFTYTLRVVSPITGQIEVFDGEALLGSKAVLPNIETDFAMLPLAPGRHIVMARVRDVPGRVSALSNPVSFDIKPAPTAAVVASPSSTAIVSLTPPAPASTSPISGTSTPTIVVLGTPTPVVTTTVTVPTPTPPLQLTPSASATVTSASGTGITATVIPPSIALFVNLPSDGKVQMGGIISGTGPVGATLRVEDGTRTLVTTEVTNQGSWQFRIVDPPFRAGVQPLRLVAINATNVEVGTRSITITVSVNLMPPSGGDLTKP